MELVENKMQLLNVERFEEPKFKLKLEGGKCKTWIRRDGNPGTVTYSGVCRVTIGELKRRIYDFNVLLSAKVDAVNKRISDRIKSGEIQERPWEDGYHPNQHYYQKNWVDGNRGVNYVIAREVGAFFHLDGVRCDFDEVWCMDGFICDGEPNEKKLIESYFRHIGVEIPEFDYRIEGEDLSIANDDFECPLEHSDLESRYLDIDIEDLNRMKKEYDTFNSILEIADKNDVNLSEIWSHVFSDLGDDCEIEFDFKFVIDLF